MQARKIKPFKSFASRRVLLSLATCSMVLVVFGAVVFASAVPGVFAKENKSPLLSAVLSGSTALAEDGQPQDDATEGESTQPGETSAVSLQQSGILSPSPTFSQGSLMSTVAAVVNTAKAEANNPSQSSSNAQNASQDQSQNQNQGQASQAQAPQPEPVFSAEAEAAFHAHIAKYYSEVSSCYNHICSGFNNVYATVNSGEKNKVVSTSPVEPSSYVKTIDAKRVAAMSCTYNGKSISSDSKWYGEYVKVWRLYENLVNAAVILREVNGLGVDYARERLAYYSNSNGKIRELAAFEQNYLKVSL